MTMRQLVERRNAIRTEMQALHAAAPDGNLQPAAATQWAALEAEATTIAAQESRQATIDDLDRRSAGAPLDGGRGGFDALREGIGLLDAVRAKLGETDERAGRAREVSKELERRSGRQAQGIYWDMRAAPAEQRVVSAAGYGYGVIPPDYRPDLFIDRLRNATRIRQLSATVLSDLRGPVTIPQRELSPKPSWVPENIPFPNDDPGFSQITMNMRSCGVITEYSRNMIMQSSPDVQQLAQDDMGRILAEALDQAAINGAGSTTYNDPKGILQTAGVGLLPAGTNGAPITFGAIQDLIGLVDDANAGGYAKMGFLTNTKVKRAVMKVVDTQGRPLGAELMYQNYPAEYSNVVPSNGAKGTGTNLSTLIFGNWSDLMLGFWSELDILVNPYESVAYSRGGVQIRAIMSVDVAVRHAASFAAITDIVA